MYILPDGGYTMLWGTGYYPTEQYYIKISRFTSCDVNLKPLHHLLVLVDFIYGRTDDLL
jgi:hypothetical protein